LNWASFASTLVIYGALLLVIAEDPADPLRTAQLFVVAIGLQTLVAIGAAILVALTSSEEPDDERVKAILRRSARYSGPVLTILVVASIFAIIAQQVVLAGLGEPSSSLLLQPLMVGHLLLFSLVLAELVRALTLSYDFRRA